MIKQLLTESKAWTHIGQKIETDGYIAFGLCNKVQLLYAYGYITASMRTRMNTRLHLHLGDTTWAYGSSRQWQARAMAAYWLALDAKYYPL